MREIIYIAVILILVLMIIILLANNPADNKKEIINTLVRQSARWATAAEQDQSPMIAVLHANYAAGYLWALRDIATDTEIEKAAGIDVLKFRNDINKIHDSTTRRLSELCAEFAPTDTYLGKIAGEV